MTATPKEKKSGSGDSSAYDIVQTGLTNLEKDPTGWMFGEPSALYSNAPPPSPPPEETTGVAVPAGEAAGGPREKEPASD